MKPPAVLDRQARERLIDTIERYLTDRITAFQFDEEIHQIQAASADPTIGHVVSMLWYHYDDIDDHSVVLSKPEWDYFYRLMLVLSSNARIEIERRRKWTPTNVGAGIALATFTLCAVPVGFGPQLLALTTAFGVIAIMLEHSRHDNRTESSSGEQAIFPFATVAEIASVRRTVPSFRKRRYPASLASRRIRSRSSEELNAWLNLMCSLLGAPVFAIVSDDS